jgi:hypothetical protein
MASCGPATDEGRAMNPTDLTGANEILLGAIAALSAVAGLFFWRYWRSSHDRFFLLFALSFWIEAANRVHIALTHGWSEDAPQNYLVRLVSFGLILLAIWLKNRGTKDRP